MSSRFFRGLSDSESESESDESVLSDEEEELSQDEAAQKQQPQHAFARGRRAISDSDESDEEEVRVVRSAKDKRFEELRAAVKVIENAKKINDWVAIQNEFERLNKAMAKASKVIADAGGTPTFYIRTLVHLEDFLKETQEKQKTEKKMNALNAKALNAMKQRLRKHNREYEDKIEEYRKNPVESGAEEEEQEEEKQPVAQEILPEGGLKKAKKPAPPSKKKPAKEDEESDESDWPSDSESESESDEEVVRGAGRSFWLNKPTTASAASTAAKKPVKKEVVKEAKPKEVSAPAAAAAPTSSASEAEGADDGFTQVGKGGKAIEIKKENFFKLLQETIEARGKKNTNRAQQILIFQKLLKFAPNTFCKIKVLLALVSSQFDYNSAVTTYLNIEQWKSALEGINSLFNLLESHPEVSVRPDYDEPVDLDKSNPEDVDLTRINGSIVPFVERLDDEWTRSLQAIDPHTTEYVDRLRDETDLYAVIIRTQVYYEKLGDDKEVICRPIMRRIEHLYYKPDAVTQLLENAAARLLPSVAKESGIVTSKEGAVDTQKLVHQLCAYQYKHAPQIFRTRAVLAHVYHHALHARFHIARDFLLMSHLQETIQNADITTQIMYNRSIVQVGICAFRNGLIKDALACLLDISATGRPKELLAQGVQLQRHLQITPEQERIERQRQLPFHMHINLELLECIFLVCSMLLEIPNIAKLGPGPDSRKKAISKPFRRALDYHERQVFTGPPESTRDHVMAASKALAVGEWQKCRDLIHSIKIWELMADFEKNKPMLTSKIQEAGLRTFLFTYASYYSSVSVAHLSASFGIPEHTVRSCVAKMIHSEELAASLDETRKLVVLHRVNLSRTQALALAFADRANAFVEANERAVEHQMAIEEREGRDPAEGGYGGGGRGGYGQRAGPGGRGGYRGRGVGGRGGGNRRTFDATLGKRLHRAGESRRME